MSDHRIARNLADEIHHHHEQACGCARDAIRHALMAGALLQRAKQELAHGEFGAWIEEHLPAISRATAHRYMQLSDRMRDQVPPERLLEPGEADTIDIDCIEDGRTLTQLYRATGIIRGLPAPGGNGKRGRHRKTSADDGVRARKRAAIERCIEVRALLLQIVEDLALLPKAERRRMLDAGVAFNDALRKSM